jgi:hypothetical protein
MATTTKLNLCSIAVSRIIGDEVSAATTDGTLFTSTDRLNAINRARGDIYTEMLKSMGMRQFLELYPEFVATSDIAFTSSVATKPAGVRRIIKAYYSSTIIEVAPVEVTLDALYNSYSKWYGSATYPVMVEYSDSGTNKLKVIGATITGNISVLYLLDLIDLTGYDSTNADMIECYSWLNIIIQGAAQYLLNTKQI